MSDFLSRVEAILSGVMNFNPKSRVERLLMKLVGSVGNVEDLETDDKSSIVAAINEIAESGGGSAFIIDYNNPVTTDYEKAIVKFNAGGDVKLKKDNIELEMTGYDSDHCYFGGSVSAYLPGGYVTAVYAHIGPNGENYFWYQYNSPVEAAGLYSEDTGGYFESTNVMGQLQEIGARVGNVENLETEDKTSLVAAINEVTESNKSSFLTLGVRWDEATMPSSEKWRSVTYGDGKFVAVVNNSNKAVYSSDGINWTAATLPSSAYWYSVTYGDGKFVAVAYKSNNAAYSSDGINWTETTLPSSTGWYSVTYGNGKFVAVANNSNNSNKAAYSSDGINWTAATLPAYADWRSVTYGNGKFVTVAYNSANAAYSSDGIKWTKSRALISGKPWYSVTYGGDKFVAVATAFDKAAYSSDGINWTAATLPSSAYWYSVTYGDGKFVAVAYNSNNAAYSSDGINWTTGPLPSSADWHSVTYGGNKFVAVANGSNKAAYSTDAIFEDDTDVTSRIPTIIPSSTAGSTKKFKITVDDSGTISAVEVTQ